MIVCGSWSEGFGGQDHALIMGLGVGCERIGTIYWGTNYQVMHFCLQRHKQHLSIGMQPAHLFHNGATKGDIRPIVTPPTADGDRPGNWPSVRPSVCRWISHYSCCWVHSAAVKLPQFSGQKVTHAQMEESKAGRRICADTQTLAALHYSPLPSKQ